jgi:hypothetical protein
MFENGFQLPDRALPFGARELVNLRGHDRQAACLRLQPLPGLDVVLQARMSAVDEKKRGDRPVPPEKRPRELLESAGRIIPAASESIAGEIHEVEGGTTSS